MATLRKSKFLFSEGERVLCYEPDSSKAKVLYDSKILECVARKEGLSRSNKKQADYLVHFYGWNSSWDRCVSEENILKDTVENRQLQRQLAEQAAGQLKGKKLKLNKIPAIIKDVVISSLNEQEDQNAKDGYEQNSHNNLENMFEEDQENSNSNYNTLYSGSLSDQDAANLNTLSSNANSSLNFAGTMNYLLNCNGLVADLNQNADLCAQLTSNLDGELKSVLEQDQNLICTQNVLYKLPVDQHLCINTILTSYEKQCLNRLIQANHTNSIFTKQTIIEFSNSMEIYFNTLCNRMYLFYTQQEQDQFKNELQSLGKHSFTFGYIHLLRLVVILPEFLAACTMPTKQLKNLLSLLKDFSSYLLLQKSKYLLESS